ncbi:ATP-binding protein [Propionivibrio sp.]|uniref:ATP-binding protein n=1 Tax=Propionivibrio sp. TaxID=2212460 RepID=UPI003BF02A2D
MSEQPEPFDELTFFEGVDLEYKSARGGLPGDLWETYSAFANTEGGTLWLGVAQDDDDLVVHGLAHPEKMVSDFWNTVNNRGKVCVNLLKSSDVEILPVPDAAGRVVRVVRIFVPRADRRQRPVFLGSDPFRGTFRRNYEGDYRCSDSEVRRMFADQSEDPADSRLLDGFTLDDLDPESLRQFRNRFASIRPGHAWLAEDDTGLLQKLGGWRRDRASGREGLTVAGLLMFGREQAIRDPAAVPGFHLDYRERFSDDPALRWTDRLTLDGTWEGNVFQFYQKVMFKLSSGPGIKRPFQIDGEGYRVAGTALGEALQEALVNALIHADYAGQGGIVIDRYSDRLAFSNPGSLLVSREQLLQGGVSECRNKSLQQMFQMLGAGDKAGSGIDRIRANWQAESWQSPGLHETQRPDRVALELPMTSTFPDGTLEKLQQRFGEPFATLAADEVRALATAHVEGEISNQRLQDMLALHRVDITQMLRGLVRKGLLRAEGVGRGRHYAISGAAAEGAPPISVGAPPISVGAPPINAGAPPTSAGAPPTSAGAPPTSAGAPPTSAGTYPHSAGQAGDVIYFNAATSAEWRSFAEPRLMALAESVRKQKRAKPEVVRNVILALCAKEFLTLQQLSMLLGRSAEKLQERNIAPLVRENLLTLRFPDTPTHREQAYRTRPGNDQGRNQGKSP